MPELPEVETVRRGLAPVVEGAVLTRVTVNRPDLRWPFPENMAGRLTGQRVLRIGRRSKYLLFDLSGGETLIVHLGMSGRMLISAGTARATPGAFHLPQRAAEKHDHVVFDLSGGARVTFNDARRFGLMDLVATDATDRHRLLRDIGPEPLGNGFDARLLADRLAGRRSPVKTALLDQRVVAGLGNIYVCEALFAARISPLRPAATLAETQVAALVPAIRRILTDAIAAGGSSLKDHRQATGELGYFQHDFKVYGREGQPCCTPGCPGVIARIPQAGRSTFHCPDCQT